MARRIGILTGGGDVPGLNSVIKEVVYRATENDFEVLGIRRGWEGLTHLDHADEHSREKYLLPLDRANTRTIDRFGGTILHSSRVSPTQLRSLPAFLSGDTFPKNDGAWDVSSHVLANIERLRLDDLIVIGGDGTLSFAHRLAGLEAKLVFVLIFVARSLFHGHARSANSPSCMSVGPGLINGSGRYQRHNALFFCFIIRTSSLGRSLQIPFHKRLAL